jgi:predicted dehydrogenase
MTKIMKVGVLGLGSIGMRHAGNLLALGHEVIGYDPNELTLPGLQMIGGWPSPREELFKTVKAVVSATPSDQHIHDLRSAVEHGVPILIEKPIATEITHELLALLREAQNDDLPIMVGYNLRFHGAVIRAKQWLDEGRIGTPHWAHFCCAQLNERYGDSVVLNWSHEIDLALYLLGPAKVDSAMLRRRGRIDIADINLYHESGAGSTVHLDYVTKPFQRWAHIAGSKGIIRLNLEAPRFATFGSSEGDVWDTWGGNDTWDENYVTEMKAFLRRAERKPAFGATAQGGVAALRICMEALK